ncbi:MAG: hypothetical protein Q9218_008362, partial [Villophora microphyllina]
HEEEPFKMRHLNYLTFLPVLTHYFYAHTTALTLPLNVTAPNPPPGFSYNIQFSATPLNPIIAYLTAIEAVFKWTVLSTVVRTPIPWDWIVTEMLSVQYKPSRSAPGGLAKVTLRPPPAVPARRPPDPLKLSYVFVGLYRGIVTMAETNQFRELMMELEYDGRTLADLQIANAAQDSSQEKTDAATLSLDAASIVLNNNSKNNTNLSDSILTPSLASNSAHFINTTPLSPGDTTGEI